MKGTGRQAIEQNLATNQAELRHEARARHIAVVLLQIFLRAVLLSGVVPALWSGISSQSDNGKADTQ